MELPYVIRTGAASTRLTSMLHALTKDGFGIQYALLTEILKKSGVPSTYLVNIINSLRISPSWADIPLPPGIDLPVLSVYSLPSK